MGLFIREDWKLKPEHSLATGESCERGEGGRTPLPLPSAETKSRQGGSCDRKQEPWQGTGDLKKAN